MTKNKVFLGFTTLLTAIIGITWQPIKHSITGEPAFYEKPETSSVFPAFYDPEDSLHDLSYQLKIHPDLPIFHFRVLRDTASRVRTILVSKGPKSKVLQTIQAGLGESPYSKADYFKGVDANFDGYTDISLLDWWGVTGNKGYSFWLFNPTVSEFVYSPEFSELANPVFDKEQKLITTFSKANKYIYTSSTYRLVADKPYLIREEKQDQMEGGHHYIKTIKIRKGKVMQDSLKVITRN